MKSLLQTKEWATLRQGFGWQAHWIDDLLVLQKQLPMAKSFLYVPEVDFFTINFTKILLKLREIAEKNNTIFIRFDFLNRNESFFAAKIIGGLKENGFIKAFEEIQPEWRQMVDIAKSEEEILAQMKPKGRYNIRVAERLGVTVEKITCPELQRGVDDFYKIFRETARRDGFSIRPKKYFEDLFKILHSAGLAELLVARYNGITVAAEIVTFFGETASYLYGASSSAYRNLMAPYLLHWEAIREAKRRGCKIYDLLAIAPLAKSYPLSDVRCPSENGKHLPAGEAGKTENHRYSGITRLKEQFGGRKVHLVGGWDLVYKPGWYRLFKLAERIRRK